MDGTIRMLRERWKEPSERAFERMFGGKSAAELETLAQRGEVAVAISRELASFHLEEHVALNAARQPQEPTSACCPKCGQAGTPAVEREEAHPERRVVTRTGEVGIRRQRRRCAKCRVIFFLFDVKLRLGGVGNGQAYCWSVYEMH